MSEARTHKVPSTGIRDLDKLMENLHDIQKQSNFTKPKMKLVKWRDWFWHAVPSTLIDEDDIEKYLADQFDVKRDWIE